MNDLVSVVVPIYNVEPYLRQCLDSIVTQSYSNLEIVLVDDGSPDRCGEICDAYARRDDRIRVIHQANRGLSAARNAGLDVMNGGCVTFVDSDDWLQGTYVEKLAGLLKEHDADISVCDRFRTADSSSEVTPRDARTRVLSRSEAITEVVKPRVGSMVTAWGKLYKARLFDQIRFPAGRLHEDEFTTYKVILRSTRVAVTTEPLYFYRHRSDSITGSSFNPNARLDALDAFRERALAFDAAGFDSAADTTYGKVLAIYMALRHHAENHSQDPAIQGFDTKNFARELLLLPQPVKFKIFYWVSLIAPRLAEFVYARLAGPRSGGS